MANVEHPNCRQPENPSQPLWRYMDFSKFVWLISRQRLFFCRADMFDDPMEGLFPDSLLNLKLASSPDPISESFQVTSGHFERVMAELLRPTVYLNCWHASDYESAAMWKVYGGDMQSIAVETDYAVLAGLLPEQVLLGEVTYTDYGPELVEVQSFQTFYMHKRRAFDYEREVRCLALPNERGPEALWCHYEGEGHPSPGISVDIDVAKLIKKVHIAPQSGAWFLDVVKETMERFGVHREVSASGLAPSPSTVSEAVDRLRSKWQANE
jgi:hypothetical protein